MEIGVQASGENIKDDANVLTTDELKNFVELRLRTNGVKVTSLAGLSDLATSAERIQFLKKFNSIIKANLDVAFTVLKTPDNLYCYSFQIQVSEVAMLKRVPETAVSGEIYKRQSIGYAGSMTLKQAMRDDAQAALDELCNTLLKANEK